jgi:alpha-glucuronidase
MRVLPRLCLLLFFACLAAVPARADDGYDLWLRYTPVGAEWLGPYRAAASQVVAAGDSPTLRAAEAELVRGLSGLLDTGLPIVDRVTRDGAVVIGTPQSSPLIAGLGLDLTGLGDEGYVIRSVMVGGHPTTVIAANSDVGVLYGAFHFLRLLQTRQPIDALAIAESPAVEHRLLNHWDNLDRTVERGYAGFSLWDWHKLPDYLDPRYTDYARANASVGINGTVLTNVNANALVLTPMYLEKAAALADVFRPYGLRVYLTARFSAPIEIGGLETADPLDPAVRAWWQEKTDEIYEYIPDFGGFLVKANSEGQPGPQDYGRSHADGANMLADALGERGIVMWRAFVYSAEDATDRAKQAVNEFVPLDGTFRDNVAVQVKNGPIDFQPREPFHPLFGAMPETPLMMEFQITKEYLGQGTHLAYLAPMWEEVLDADTYVEGPGSEVVDVIDGSLHGYDFTGIAGVSNVGTDHNWTGSIFDQANWYAFGRLAWDPSLDAEAIARAWTGMTFRDDPALVEPVVGMMMDSREAVVDYMTPLGLHHLMATGHHYGPGPWVGDLSRPEWNPTYYHRANEEGIGFDRTETGSDAVSQYAPPVAERFGDLETVPEEFLLWFHHVPWDYEMPSGRTLWAELVHRYTRGVERVEEMRATWAGLENYVDPERHAQVAAFLAIQEQEAQWWRDASIAYFQTFADRPIPEGYAPPEHPLAYYQSLSFPYAPGH